MSEPLVGIVVGSESDRERMQPALDELEARGIAHEFEVRSAHRQPDAVAEYGRTARDRGLRVLIAGAGLAAALPLVEERPRRARRPALDRADAARRSRRLCRRRQRQERRRPRREDHRAASLESGR
jgi:AIR carboxylase